MSFHDVQIGDLGRIVTGKTPPTNDSENYNGFIPFVTPADLNGNRSLFQTERYISDKGKETVKNCLLPKNSVCVSCIGSDMGKTAITTCPSVTNQQINSIIVHDHYNYLYVYYLMCTLEQTIKSLGKNGTAIPILNKSKFSSIRIRVPDYSTQSHIANILSAYDDLIENNQKQIKLLEEEAQRLYKEWFIDLRFLGYENTPVHDGVPEGWEICALNRVAKVNAYSLPKNYAFDYMDYIDLSAVSVGTIEGSTRYSVADAPGRAKRIAHDGDVIWGMVRPNLKSYALVFHPSDTDVFSTGFAVLSAEKVPFTYLYCAATQPSFVSYLINCTNGAAYPAVRPEHFEKAMILKPTDDTLRRFNKTVEPLFRKTEALQDQNKRLTEARDRLLPKLMSGEIEV